jgi:hypothetical protein
VTSDEKLEMLTLLLDPDDAAAEKLDAYLQIARKEILAWRYSYAASMPDEVPEEYEMTQIQAVMAGFNMSGAENQTQHSENGITRSFRYADMLAYIRSHVIPFAGVY